MKQIITKVFLVVALMVIGTQAVGYELRDAGDDFVRWHKTEIKIILDPSLEMLGPMNKIERAIMETFQVWIQDADLPIDFRFMHGTCKEPGYSKDQANSNCIMASDSKEMWESHSGDPGATTLVTYTPDSGEIIDGDIVYNAADWDWSINEEVKGSLSFKSVTAHEIGHLLGLGHSDVLEATMFPKIRLGETIKETLHVDDTDAIDSLYVDFDPEIYLDDTAIVNCDGMAVAAGGTPTSWLFFLGFLAVLMLRQRILRPVFSRRQNRPIQKS